MDTSRDDSPAIDYHPYRAPKTRAGINDLIREARKTIFPWDEDLSTRVCAALTAERDRADRAEAALVEAWNKGAEAAFYDPESRDLVSWGKNPYRSEATA